MAAGLPLAAADPPREGTKGRPPSGIKKKLWQRVATRAEFAVPLRPIKNNRGKTLEHALTPDAVYKLVKAYSLELGFEIGAHALRATAATNALDHQADIAKVQEWLGHANISTTRIYDHRKTNLLRRCWLERLRHGIASRQSSRATSSGGRLRFENLVARGKCDPRLLAAGPDVPGRPQP